MNKHAVTYGPALLAAFGIGLVAVPAQAQAEVPAARGQAADSESSAPADQPAASPRTKYCIMEGSTGSHIRKKACRTRQEWKELGVEVPTK